MATTNTHFDTTVEILEEHVKKESTTGISTSISSWIKTLSEHKEFKGIASDLEDLKEAVSKKEGKKIVELMTKLGSDTTKSKGKLVTTNYNQTSMLRTIEQILGLPPMNIIDASARLMTDCFESTKNSKPYSAVLNNIPLDEMNPEINTLSGKAKKFALESRDEAFKDVDGGEDDKMNRILWFYAKGNSAYPKKPVGNINN